MGNKYELPYLAELFQLLITGKHICSQDNAKYYALQEKPEDYKVLFKALGYELVIDPRDFFYFKMPGKANTEGTKQMALFIFLLIEHLDKRENDLESALMNTRFMFATLPHLKSERYRELMSEVKIVDEDGLISTVSSMQKYGFATLYGKESFQFKSPVHRFFNLCAEEILAQEQTSVEGESNG